MAVFVLIPGMWHGGWCWKKAAPLLRAAGHEVYTPTLTGLGERAHLRNDFIDLNTHIQDIVNLLNYEDLQGVILIGHSLGGIITPVIAEQIPERIARIINLDGIIPVNGKPMKDLIGDTWDFFKPKAIEDGDEGWVSPIPDWTFGVSGSDLAWIQSKLSPHPLKTLESPLLFSDQTLSSIPHTFIHGIEGASLAEIADQEKECARSNWQYQTLAAGHDAMITKPDEFVKNLLELVA